MSFSDMRSNRLQFAGFKMSEGPRQRLRGLPRQGLEENMSLLVFLQPRKSVGSIWHAAGMNKLAADCQILSDKSLMRSMESVTCQPITSPVVRALEWPDDSTRPDWSDACSYPRRSYLQLFTLSPLHFYNSCLQL